jgi:3',5'-cyclic AMP phosphodiesterase CpdA
MRIRSFFLLIYFVFSLNISGIATPRPFNALLLTDTHICNLDGYNPVLKMKRDHYAHGVAPLRQFLQTKPKQLDADVVILTGDMLDFYEAENEKGIIQATQIEQFYDRIYKISPVPLWLTIGNHDIATYWYEGDTPDDRRSFTINADKARAAWIRNIACFQEGTYYTQKADIGETEYTLIFLDNHYSYNKGEYLDDLQSAWLQHQVEKAGVHPVILFMHYYLHVGDTNGDGIAFEKNDPLVIDDQTCSKGLLKILNHHPNIQALFVGHGHENIFESIPMLNGHEIVQVQTAAFGRDENNWRFVQFHQDHISVSVAGNDAKELLKINID